MKIFEGKWRTRGGDVVTVRNSDRSWSWAVEAERGSWSADSEGRWSSGRESSNDLISPVIEPGSEWRIDGGRYSVVGPHPNQEGIWFAVWNGGATAHQFYESAFHTPWVDPTKPRVVKAWACFCQGRVCVSESKADVEAWRDPAFPVVEVTLTETLNGKDATCS